MASRWLKRATVTTAVAGLALVFGPGTAWAANINSASRVPPPPPTVVVWTGNGTTAGACNDIGTFDDLNPGPGQQGWLFILTSPFDNTGSALSYAFSDGTASPPTVAGVLQGNGSYHFAVYTNAGATLSSASATNGTAQSQLTVSHCEVRPGSSITSEVHLAGSHTVVSNASPGTAPATVHDKVTLTVTGLDQWSGAFTLKFFTNNNCSGDAADTFTTTWNQDTTMPQDNLLPKGPLGAGDYSYQESFNSDNDDLDVVGACEPFKIVEPPTSSGPPCPQIAIAAVPCTTTTLPTTGSAVGGLVVTGAALVAVGGSLVAFLLIGRRRRAATENSSQ